MGMPEVTINPVGTDAEDQLTLRYEWSGVPTGDREFERHFRACWQTERHRRRAFVAHAADGRPVGIANALIYTRVPSPGRPTARWLYAANVFVTPTFRRRGVAASLMTEVIDAARAEGMVRIVLAPSEMSIPLYRSLGFRVADDLMRLDLE